MAVYSRRLQWLRTEDDLSDKDAERIILVDVLAICMQYM